jgi:hypothetical protein
MARRGGRSDKNFHDIGPLIADKARICGSPDGRDALRRNIRQPRSRPNGQHGERARLRQSFRNWILRYVCNATAGCERSAAFARLTRDLSLSPRCPNPAVATTAGFDVAIGRGADLFGPFGPQNIKHAERRRNDASGSGLGIWGTRTAHGFPRRALVDTNMSSVLFCRLSSRRCAPRPMSSPRRGSEKAQMRVQRRRAARARDPRPLPERAHRRQCRARISQGGSAAPD